MFLADTLSRATTPCMGKTDETIGTSHIMKLHSIRSTTEIKVEEIDMLRNLSVKDTTVSQIRQATEADSVLRELKTVIKNGWPCKRSDVSPVLHPYHPFRDDLVEQNGVIFKGERLIVPPTMRHSLIERLHSNHADVQANLRRARDVFYWPGMNRDIEKCVASCGVCSLYQSAPQKEPLKSYPIPARPWQYIGTDLCQLHGKDYLVTVDYYSNFIEVDRLYSTSSSAIIHKLKAHMARHGIPERVVRDNGPQYSSKEFRSFAQQYEFEHVSSSPGYPQSNGKAESAVKQAKRIMEKAIAAKEDPYLALVAHRNTPSDGMTTSPAQRLFGRKTRTRLPTSSRLLDPVGETATAREELTKAKFKQALYFDRTAKPLPELQICDPVGMLPKTGEKTWVRAKVTAKVSPRSYIVATRN